jgi:branched-chain amino acid transport system permease protein
VKAVGAWLVAIGLLAAAPYSVGTWTDLLTELLIWALFALSLDLIFGYATLYSFGHAAFFGAGAYAAALTVHHGIGGFWTGLVAGVVAGCVVGSLVALFAARSAGVVFIILTAMLSHVLFTLAHVLTRVTGGENGIYLFKPLVLWNDITTAAGNTFYWLVLALTVGALALARRVIRSPFGHVIIAIRENEGRTQAMGYNTTAFKVKITLFSAALGGLAGALNAFMNKFVSPESLGLALSTQVVIWALLGGMGTLVGPMVGAIALVVVADVLNRFVTGYVIVIGAILIFTVIFLPGGIVGLLPGFRSRVLADLRRGR